MEIKHPVNNIQFLDGGGEMGKLTKEKDWSKTSLGSPKFWPQSLRTTLSIILNSKFPMFLFWGEELICFYNDAYRPSLGIEGKHPSILGLKGEEAWTEIWHIIKPLIDQVLAGGEATWSEDQLIPIYRNGKVEDVYWTFSYSPVNDESGKPAGVFVTCTETTEKILILSKLEESKNQLEFAIEATELGTWDYSPLTNKFSSNERIKKWFGLPENDQIELTHAVNAILESDRQRVTEAIQKSLNYASGGNYDIEYTIVNAVTKKEFIVHAKGRAWFNDKKVAYRFNGTLEDITEQATARKKIEETQNQIRKELADTQQLYKVSTQLINEDKIEILYQQILEAASVVMDADCASFQLLNPDKNELILLAWKGFHPETATFWSTVSAGETSSSGKALESARRVVVTDVETCDFMAGTKNLKHYRLSGIRSVQSTPLVSRDGKIVGMISTHWKESRNIPEKNLQLLDILARQATDLIERKQSEEKIKESAAQFNTLADNIANLTWMAKADGWIYWYNKKWYEYTGTTPEQMEGWGWQSVHDPEQLPSVMKNWQESVESGQPFEMIFPLKGADGKFRHFLTRVLPIKNKQGKIQQWFGTNTDITVQKETEDFIKESENRYRSLADNIPMITFIIEPNPEATISYWNKTWLDYTGQTYEEALGRAWDGIIHPEDVQGVIDIYVPAFEKRQSYFIPAIRVKRYDGIYRWHLFTANPRYLPGGEFIGYIGVGFDIHNQKLSEDILKESEERFRSLAQSLPQLVWVTDGQGKTEFASSKWKEYTGIEPGGEEKWKAIVHPDDYNNINAAWAHSLITGDIYRSDVRLKSKDGEYRWHAVKGEPVLDMKNKIVKWVGAFTDTHDQKIKEEKKDEFISIASHEMKTPLTTTKAYLQMLELSLDKNDENANMYAKKAIRSVNRLNKLISELLDVSKIRLGKLNYTVTTFDFNDMIDSTVEDIQLTSPTHTIIKTGKVYDEITGDRDRLQQVIINILNNAIKYSPGAEKVFVTVAQEKDIIKVSVKDTGIGIARQSLNKIFDKYHRIEEHSAYFQGLGIGLFISHEIVQRHHGKLLAESEPGKGSTFYLTLPLRFVSPA